jgi:hypothetical protein
MQEGNIPQGNKSKPTMVNSAVNGGSSQPSSKSLRVGNTKKDGQMDKPFKG